MQLVDFTIRYDLIDPCEPETSRKVTDFPQQKKGADRGTDSSDYQLTYVPWKANLGLLHELSELLEFGISPFCDDAETQRLLR